MEAAELGRAAVARGLLTEEQLRECLAYVHEERPLESVLVDMGYLTPTTLSLIRNAHTPGAPAGRRALRLFVIAGVTALLMSAWIALAVQRSRKSDPPRHVHRQAAADATREPEWTLFKSASCSYMMDHQDGVYTISGDGYRCDAGIHCSLPPRQSQMSYQLSFMYRAQARPQVGKRKAKVANAHVLVFSTDGTGIEYRDQLVAVLTSDTDWQKYERTFYTGPAPALVRIYMTDQMKDDWSQVLEIAELKLTPR